MISDKYLTNAGSDNEGLESGEDDEFLDTENVILIVSLYWKLLNKTIRRKFIQIKVST